MLIFSTSFVQTRLAKIATQRINEDLSTEITVDKLDLSLLGSVQLKGIKIRDHHKDTLIFVDNLRTSLLNAKKIIDNKVNLGDVTLSGVHFIMKKYKGEERDNLAIFIDEVEGEDKEKSETPFILTASNIYFDNLTYKLSDEDKKNPIQFSAHHAGGSLQDFLIEGPDVSAKIRGLHLTDNRGINVTNMSCDFSYSKTKMVFNEMSLETNNKSHLKTNLVFNYKIEDLKNFTNKVKIKSDFKKSKLAVKDIRKFYGELGGNDMLHFTGNARGILNNFSLENFDLYSRKGMKVKGDMGFLNAFNTEKGFVYDADLAEVTSSYIQLKNILPNVLGKTLPSNLERLGKFSTSGVMKVTPEQVDAILNISSEIGGSFSNLQITNIDDIDNAAYNGNIELHNFHLGKFVKDADLGKVTLAANVNGTSFEVDNISTAIIGRVSSLWYRGYNYKNLNVNGLFENKKFDGVLEARDENFNLNFQGLADFSSQINKFDFTADIENVDLQETNLFTRDSIATIKGKIKLDVSGNTLDNIIGKAKFNDLVYTNQTRSYPFKAFEVESSVKDSIKTIKIDSKDIVKGHLEGKFTFEELLPVTQNALGSVYTNYTPISVAPNQYINFDFTIYNQIVEVFLPEVSIATNTKIKGKIDANKNAVKLTFASPGIKAYGNSFDKLLLRLDNKNRLYNTHLTANKISTGHYDFHKLNLLNRTVNDTLFFKSTFKGGKKLEEDFNVDFFYTINADKKSVVGIQKSTFQYNEFDWVVNPKDNKDNKVTFNVKENDFKFDPFELVSGEQKITFSGILAGEDKKDLKANFEEVQLKSFLPNIENITLEGVLNGKFALLQNEQVTQPIADIVVNDVIVNEFSQGTLKMKVEGENSLDKYKIDVSLRDYLFDNVKIVGDLDFSTEEPTMDLSASFKEYELNGYSDLGEEVLSNLRGRLSGNFTAKGAIKNPDFQGNLNLIEAGMTFPYLNIDFDFIENTDILVEGQSFKINNMILEDTKYDTKGVLSGNITHQNFEQWYLNLDVDTQNLLVLDTKEVEEVPYYGSGFISGNAQIIGLTSNLTIEVNGTTQPGTTFVIPLNDVTTLDNYKLIHFKTEDQKENQVTEIEKISGLNLNINLDVTKDALAQVVIDKVSGSELKGSGTGNLDIEINTRGKFLMNGTITIDNGLYNFRYGGIITRPFRVQRGGIISWNGDPFEAELDLFAVYQTKANPAQLLDNISSNRKIPIDLYTKITGGLFNSTQEFDIKIPNADSTVASELEFKLNDNDTNNKMRQFFSLLVTGNFFNQGDVGLNASSLSANTASDLLSNVLSGIINAKDSKFQLGVGYTQGDRTEIEGAVNSDNQVDVSVTSQLSDRVLFNGKVGVPVGADIQTEVIGEAKLEVLLNEQGNLRWTIFNKPNDIRFSVIEEEGYTQGTGLSYQVNFNSLSDLAKKIGAKKKKTNTKDEFLKQVTQRNEKNKDTLLVVQKKKLINFTNSKKDTTKINNEPNN